MNQAVKRNLGRFPEDFMFQLTQQKFENWKSQFVTSNSGKKCLFANVTLSLLNTEPLWSPIYSEALKPFQSAFKWLELLFNLGKWTHSHAQLIKKVDSMQAFMLKNAQSTTQEFRKVWEAIEQIMNPKPVQEERRIGFKLDEYTSKKF